MDSKNKEIAEKLRFYRESCALSHQQVADALNIDKGGYLFFYDGSSSTFRFDLNGYSQTAASIAGNQYGQKDYQATNPDSYSFTVTSATPATLTLDGTSSRSELVKVIDQASLTYAGTATQTIGYATSTTKGTLTVDSGAIRLERNAKWLGTNVVLSPIVVKIIDAVKKTNR